MERALDARALLRKETDRRRHEGAVPASGVDRGLDLVDAIQLFPGERAGTAFAGFATKVAVDGVFGDAAPRAPLPRSGDRISFFWTEEDGWWDCEVVERVAPGFYSVKWDVDGSITRVQLDDDNANRWRLVPRQRPPEQSERRKRG